MNGVKKFINDYIVFFVLGALIVGGIALYKVTKKEEEKPTDKPAKTEDE